jgi:hypothetical protein
LALGSFPITKKNNKGKTNNEPVMQASKLRKIPRNEETDFTTPLETINWLLNAT